MSLKAELRSLQILYKKIIKNILCLQRKQNLFYLILKKNAKIICSKTYFKEIILHWFSMERIYQIAGEKNMKLFKVAYCSVVLIFAAKLF